MPLVNLLVCAVACSEFGEVAGERTQDLIGGLGPGERPGMARSVCGGTPPPSMTLRVSSGNGLRPPLTAEPLCRLRRRLRRPDPRLPHRGASRRLAPLRASCRLPPQRRDDRTRSGWLRRVHPRRQSQQYQCRPAGQGRGHTCLAPRPALTADSLLACLGATLGARRMNDLVVLWTDVNNGKRQARGRGLI
jgi:hypothetical protein